MVYWVAITLVVSLQISLGGCLKCDSMPDKSLPCVEVPKCNSGADLAEINIYLLSNGRGNASADSIVQLCFSDTEFYLYHRAMGQKYMERTDYSQCNDPVFNSNVAEIFIAPNMEKSPHCYNELDISPYNVMFDAGIYNEDLNYKSVEGYPFDCESANITHSTLINMEQNEWQYNMTLPFSLLNCPYNCPMKRYCGHTTPNNIYRANLFRINQITQEQAECTSDTCEYMAWNPTGVNPPAFHEPEKFGFLLLQL
mmetsp:Transcript_21705/g.36689  ORF Transcript_21705/g.36689 Transcript_21705/m.36689 type:complete len:254 (+) Transcript_21705:81-842(+)